MTSGISRAGGEGTHKVRVASALEEHADGGQEDGETVCFITVSAERWQVGDRRLT